MKRTALSRMRLRPDVPISTNLYAGSGLARGFSPAYGEMLFPEDERRPGFDELHRVSFNDCVTASCAVGAYKVHGIADEAVRPCLVCGCRRSAVVAHNADVGVFSVRGSLIEIDDVGDNLLLHAASLGNRIW